VRLIRVVRGEMRCVIDCQPRFDYGRSAHKSEFTDDGVLFLGNDGLEFALHVVRRVGATGAEQAEVTRHGDGIRAVFTAGVGDLGGLVFESAPDGPPRELAREEILELLERTRDFWRGWVSRSRHRGRWREHVERSAVTLKLLTYEPTGALVAAPTAGLPEQPGGERNWDYRYTWVRDGSFSVHAPPPRLHRGGSGLPPVARRRVDEAAELTADGAAPPLKIMYRVDGSWDLEEQVLDHLEGWRESRPDRQRGLRPVPARHLR
jgi:GH15 family glucan-1,4-alpha-glucosidase